MIILICASGCKSSRKKKHKGRFGASKTAKYSRKDKGSTAALKAEVHELIKVARSYTGTPYKYAGTTRIGMDCSGLMVTSFQAIGMQLPRSSAEQSNLGKPVAIDELRPGDLVFFADKKVGKGITHVGLVTEIPDANTIRFIHTSSKLGVVENNLYTPYFKDTFAKAVRVF